MTTDPDERTRLMTGRVVVLALAILVSGAGAPLVVEAAGWPAMGAAVAGLLLLGALGAYVGTRGAPEMAAPAPTGSLRAQLRLVAAVADFRWLLLTFVVQALGIGAMLAGVAYASRWLLDDPTAASLLFVAFVGPALVVTPLWERFARRRGKRAGWTVSSLVLVAGALGLWAASGGSVLGTCLAAAVAGVGYAGAQVFPLAMLPDVAAADAAATGTTRTGVFTGVWTAGETLGLALGPGLYALVLQLGGYAAGATEQDAAARTAIVAGFALVPAVLVAASLLALRRYTLDERSAGVR